MRDTKENRIKDIQRHSRFDDDKSIPVCGFCGLRMSPFDTYEYSGRANFYYHINCFLWSKETVERCEVCLGMLSPFGESYYNNIHRSCSYSNMVSKKSCGICGYKFSPFGSEVILHSSSSGGRTSLVHELCCITRKNRVK